MMKTLSRAGSVQVKFTLDPAVGARSAAVCGDWNGWSGDVDVMKKDRNGGFNTTVELEPGRIYRFRYLLDGERWENDWEADAYPPNEFGGDDSLVDLTEYDRAEPAPAAKKTAAKKTEPVAKKTAAKATAAKATAAKKAPPVAKETAAKETAAKETAAKQTAAKKAPPAAKKTEPVAKNTAAAEPKPKRAPRKPPAD